MQIERQGWEPEDGLMIHLVSEASVDMDGYAYTLEDEIVFGGSSVEKAMDYIENRYEREGHSMLWSTDWSGLD